MRRLQLLLAAAAAAAAVAAGGARGALTAEEARGQGEVHVALAMDDGLRPSGVSVGRDTGAVYVSEATRSEVWRLDPLAGTAVVLSTGFSSPRALLADEAGGVLYVADTDAHCVRTVPLPAGGAPSTLAGECGTHGLADAPAADARFYYPSGLALAWGGLVVADTFNHRLRLVDLAGAPLYNVTTVAGEGAAAGVRFPADVAAGDHDGALYFVQDHCVRRVPSGAAAGAAPETVAGDCDAHGYADGGGAAARFNHLTGVWADPDGNVFVADEANGRVRHLNTSGLGAGAEAVVRTAAGTGERASADGSPLHDAAFVELARLGGHGVPANGSAPMYATDAGAAAVLRFGATCEPACVNGACWLPGECRCDYGFEGAACDMGVCASACPAGQVCVGKDLCGCPDGYSGAACADAVCAPACENGGACVLPDVCSCAAGLWQGDTCEEPVCAPACQNGGNCTAPGVCTCEAGVWEGAECEEPVCAPACENGGNCTAPGTCACADGWEGAGCAEAVCDSPCQNGGNCTAPNVCECPDEWQGGNCSVPACAFPCVHGTCVNPNLCTCDEGWSGTTCEEPLCGPTGTCANGGVCATPGNCTCPPGWQSSNCSEPRCAPECEVGELCSAPFTCVTACDPPCLNGGACTASHNCSCAGGWVGADCSVSPCPDSCAHGACETPNVCSCDSGWSGANCSVPVCTLPCENGGSCVAPETCACVDDWRGPTCGLAVCGDEDLGGCINGGVCVRPGVCNCTEGYDGELCATAICLSGCLNGGECLKPDECACPGGFTGNDCARSVAPRQLASTTTVAWISVTAAVPVLVMGYVAWRTRLGIDKRRLRKYRRSQAYGGDTAGGTGTDADANGAGDGAGDGSDLSMSGLYRGVSASSIESVDSQPGAAGDAAVAPVDGEAAAAAAAESPNARRAFGRTSTRTAWQ